jgi:V8-like Glu-specific endopeptidase
MSRVKTHLTGVVLAFLVLGILSSLSGFGQPGRAQSGQTGPRQTLGQRAEKPFDRDAAQSQQKRIHEWLVSEVLREGLSLPLSTVVTQDEIAQVEEDNSVPAKVGLTKSVEQRISFADLLPSQISRAPQTRSHGALRGTPDGGYVFTLALESQDAVGLRVHFSNFWLPEQAELYLFTSEGQVFGPYTGGGPHGDGKFWSHTVMGERVILQLRHFGSVTSDDLEDTWFVISKIGHLSPKFLSGTHCSYNESCIENVNCGADSAVNNARDAVAHMQWVSGPFLYMCTGGLLADTDPSSDIPYFLSANHCISRNKDARNLECFFQLTVACGTAPCPNVFDTRANHPQSLRTLGATIKATNSTSDYTLFELKESAPNGSVLMGWDSTAVANANATPLYRISHPGGAPQAYSAHQVDTSKPTCRSWPRGAWIYTKDIFGATEGGSSGSPVVNSSGQVVGQLSGGCGYNVNDPCDANSNATVDGAFANYFNEVSQFLDPTPCNPSPEICSDSIDNDCDGEVDCNDADCSGDPSCETTSSCSGHGTKCSSNTECCSGNCKRGTCKGN